MVENINNSFLFIVSSQWLLIIHLIILSCIIWTIHKHFGFQLLYLTTISITLAHIFLMYFPYLYTLENTVPVTNPIVQTMAVLFTFFIPIVKKRIQILYCLLTPVFISILFITLLNTPIITIVNSLFIGGFIIFTFYRTLDWIGSLPERYFIVLATIIPLFLLVIMYPHFQLMIYPGILLGSGVGKMIESLKVRIDIPSFNMKGVTFAFIFGTSGILIISSGFLFNAAFFMQSFLTGLMIGLWITLITPLLLRFFNLYQSDRSSKVF